MLEQLQAREEALNQDFDVEEDNWAILICFLACQTQWRKEFAGMEGVLIWHGLDYPAASVVIRMMGHRGQEARDIFAGLQIMEAAALPLLNKRKT